MTAIRPFSTITLADLPEVGGKNASLGELLGAMSTLGVRVPDGFAVTASAYRQHLADHGLAPPIEDLLAGIRTVEVEDLGKRASRIRNLILGAPLAPALVAEITAAYRRLGDGVSVAVRSSATAEDLPGASFAGQQDSFLHVVGEAALLDAVRRCFASLFTARAIAYRIDHGFDHAKVALSVGVQRMVRSDRGAAGVAFTLDTESGFRDVVLITSAWGLGENIVQGRVRPDEIYVHKPTLEAGARPILWKKIGAKEQRLVLDESLHRVVNQPTPPEDRRRLSLSDEDVLTLARWSIAIEKHYSALHGKPTPMDIEWAKEGPDGPLFVVQARPETVHSARAPSSMRLYHFKGHVAPIAHGTAVGEAIGVGRARVVASAAHLGEVQPGDVLVTDTTDPDWEPVMKRAAAIVTERGGRTSHAAIIARELGIPAIVGAEDAMKKIAKAQSDLVTVSCAQGEEGKVYWGEQPFDVEEVRLADVPATRTKIYVNLARPDSAFRLAQLPCDGVGLARMEFVLASWIGIHPMALVRYATLPVELRDAVDARTDGRADRVDFFVDRLSQGIGVLAAAFWPRPVILRFSDFKSSEYIRLAGGLPHEPVEPNPMIGWRGASRYYDAAYRDAFTLECLAVRRVRESMGLTNLQLMVPFCRTPEEAVRVFQVADAAGLKRTDTLWHVMAEIPSNILLADRFAELFDGFSIGSNDLTQLVLGVDRDSRYVARLFDERNEAVKRACLMLLETAHAKGRPVGICGQAPSDYPDFAAFLVEHGIDSMSLAPDAVVPTRRSVAELEARR